jgi:hypothetical protein
MRYELCGNGMRTEPRRAAVGGLVDGRYPNMRFAHAKLDAARQQPVTEWPELDMF